MPPRAIFPLRYAAVCFECGLWLKPGTKALRRGKNFYCMACAPVTHLPDGRAMGAEDSSVGDMHASHGVNHQQGGGRRDAIPISRFDTPPGKRRRLPMELRRKRQHRNND